MSEGPVVAVGGIAVQGGRLLMVRRARDPGRGLWSVPGGRVERGELLEEAVAREVREETGVAVTAGALAGIFEVVGDPHYVVLDFLAHPLDDATPRPGGDAAEARWVPLDDVARLDCTPRFVETLRGWGVLP